MKNTNSLFVPKKPILSVSDLVKRVANIDGPSYFRGLPNQSWGLIPTIAWMKERKLNGLPVRVREDVADVQEQFLLHRFRRHTYEERGRVLNQWEALFLARHHGLPVRLLDWTTNPLVALYFACISEGEPTTDGAIFSFNRRYENPEIDVFVDEDPFAIKGVRIVQPFYPTRKMTAQSGTFTIHAFPWLNLAELDRGDPYAVDMSSGEKWIIPKDSKVKICRELMRLGINARTLFPDLAGLVEGLLALEVIRDPDEYARPSARGIVR